MRHAARRRVDVAFERGAGAERDDRHLVLRADAHGVLHVLGGLRKHHRVRRLVLDPGEGVAVLLAHRLRGDEAVAELGGERADRGLDRLRISRLLDRLYRRQCHVVLPGSECGRDVSRCDAPGAKPRRIAILGA